MPGIIQIDDINHSQALIGNNDEHINAIEENLMSNTCWPRNSSQRPKIEPVEKSELVLKNLLKVIEMGNTITLKDVEAAIKMAKMIQYITLLIYMTKKLQKMLTEKLLEQKLWDKDYMLMQ